VPKVDTIAIARDAFGEIANRFPSLRMTEEVGTPVEISIIIPVQPGCGQKIWLCLQNIDELHFSVGHFWLEWFPCTDNARVESYVEAVTGVLEHYRGKKCVKAELQAPEGSNWHTVGTWSTLWLPMPWTKGFKEIRNI
jgi:hypothetical protein